MGYRRNSTKLIAHSKNETQDRIDFYSMSCALCSLLLSSVKRSRAFWLSGKQQLDKGQDNPLKKSNQRIECAKPE